MNSALIKRDLRQLSKTIYEENNINDWRKLIIMYNIYLIYSQTVLILYCLSIDMTHNFRSIYLFLFLCSSLQNSYAYGILNIHKINPSLASSIHNNFVDYAKSFN
jgi:uncharacterized protein (DUF608 family)